MIRTIAMVIVDRANWGRLQPLAEAIRDEGSFNLYIICGGSSVLNRFKVPADDIEEAGFTVVARVFHEVEGNTPTTMAQSIGLGTMQYAVELDRIKPDLVITIGDRFEMLAVATAAACLNINNCHLQGGEVSGSLDEKWRHAISKLADWHVPATARAMDNLIRMGEQPSTVLAVGCPSADLAAKITPKPNGKLLVMYHPNTTQWDKSADEMQEILTVVHRLATPCILMWPNIDSGSDTISKTIRQWRDATKIATVKYVTNLEPSGFQQELANAACCVGNSSSFVRDSGYYGAPVVLVGNRQDGRETSENVLRCEANASSIMSAVYKQFGKRYHPSDLYGKPGISAKIVKAIKQIEPYAQKRLAYSHGLITSLTVWPYSNQAKEILDERARRSRGPRRVKRNPKKEPASATR